MNICFIRIQLLLRILDFCFHRYSVTVIKPVKESSLRLITIHPALHSCIAEFVAQTELKSPLCILVYLLIPIPVSEVHMGIRTTLIHYQRTTANSLINSENRQLCLLDWAGLAAIQPKMYKCVYLSISFSKVLVPS